MSNFVLFDTLLGGFSIAGETAMAERYGNGGGQFHRCESTGSFALLDLIYKVQCGRRSENHEGHHGPAPGEVCDDGGYCSGACGGKPDARPCSNCGGIYNRCGECDPSYYDL